MYRLHRQSGQAIVTLTNGLGTRRDVLLGPHGTATSRAEYARVLAEWEANGRSVVPPIQPGPAGSVSVAEVLLAYLRYAEGYYRKNDKPTSQVERIKLALKPMRELYGHTAANDFGPKALKAVRERMITMAGRGGLSIRPSVASSAPSSGVLRKNW
jgi:hypothetical protein